MNLCVVYNEPTDREDWLQRMLDSAKNGPEPLVYRYADSAPFRKRCYDIASKLDGWVTFADPDDFLLPREYGRLLQHLETTEADAVWTYEFRAHGQFMHLFMGHHHLVCLRDKAKEQWLRLSEQHEYKLRWDIQPDIDAECFPHAVYVWNMQHGSNTRGIDKQVR